MKKIYIYREGNPYMSALSGESQQIVLKYGQEERWADIITENISEDVKVIYTDITVKKLVESVAQKSVRVTCAYDDLCKYEERETYYKLLLSEALKYDNPIIILDYIADHMSKREDLEDGIMEEIKQLAEKNNIMTAHISEIKWSDEGTILTDHHILHTLEYELQCLIRKKFRFVCPCCIISEESAVLMNMRHTGRLPNLTVIGRDKANVTQKYQYSGRVRSR